MNPNITSTQFLSAPTGNLFIQSLGNTGEPVLMIHGACTDSDFFLDTAAVLSKHFRVWLYDRRGYGRSDTPSDGNYSIEAQSEDTAYIIRKCIGEPTHIIGHSAGTTVAMTLATRHPELVKGIFLHEPVAASCLPENYEIRHNSEKISEYIQQGKYGRALCEFIPHIGNKDPRARENTPEEDERLSQNCRTFIKNEFDFVFHHEPDVDALKKVPVRVGVGELSRNSHRFESGERLATLLNCPVIYFPAAHNCAFDLPKEFAWLVGGALEEISASMH